MEHLQRQLDELIGRLDDPEEMRVSLEELISVYPFSSFEYAISHLLAMGKMTLEEYYELRSSYIERNPYLYLFEMSTPRGFGELWAQGHLKELVPTLQRPSKRLDPNYSGQYDFFLPPDIHVEVKASRAVAANSSEPLYIKALASDSSRPFDMNFQQIKPESCDVFVWIAAWRDGIKFWVLPSASVESNRYYSKGQHRGNVGEGQLHLNRENIHEFDVYLTQPNRLEDAIRAASTENRRLRGAKTQPTAGDS